MADAGQACASPSAASRTIADGARLAADLTAARSTTRSNAFAYELDARDDVHATARYRRDLVRLIGRDLIGRCCHDRV